MQFVTDPSLTQTKSELLPRREVLKRAATAAVGVCAPYFVPATALSSPNRPGANDRIGVGVIGSGSRASQLIDHLPADGQIVALCDVFLQRANDINKYKKKEWPIHQNYHDLLERKDVDAVIIATHDHGRVLPCIHACQAGKDIYAEKPLTLTVREGRVLVDFVRKHERVFQVGTQQRSMEMNISSCEFVRDGGLGKVEKVLCLNFENAGDTAYLEQPMPDGLDWSGWCGQTEMVPYHPDLHWGWMNHRRYSGGSVTNLGAHAFDMVQYALGTSHTGPVEFWPVTEGIINGQVFFRYANGITVENKLEGTGPILGGIFIGENGKIEINRNKFTTNPKDLVPNPPDPSVAEPWEAPGWVARPHLQNWLDCIKSREIPVADVEIGHRTASICHLLNITRQVGRPFAWDPEIEQSDDEEVNALLERPRRKGFELPSLS